MKTIEERIFDDVKLAVTRRDQETTEALRELLIMINSYKEKIYPTVATDLLISKYFETAEFESELAKSMARNYMITDPKNVLLNIYADKILKEIKFVDEPESFMKDLTDLVLERYRLTQN